MPTHSVIAAGVLPAAACLLASLKTNPELALATIRFASSIFGGGLLVSLHFFHCGGVAAQCASGCDRAVTNWGDSGHTVLPVISSQ
jgi:hypothetical protein